MIESQPPSGLHLMPPCSRGGAAHDTEIETRLKSNNFRIKIAQVQLLSSMTWGREAGSIIFCKFVHQPSRLLPIDRSVPVHSVASLLCNNSLAELMDLRRMRLLPTHIAEYISCSNLNHIWGSEWF